MPPSAGRPGSTGSSSTATLPGILLPNQRNREKICRYFRIGEPELFREKGEKPSKIDGDFRIVLVGRGRSCGLKADAFRSSRLPVAGTLFRQFRDTQRPEQPDAVGARRAERWQPHHVPAIDRHVGAPGVVVVAFLGDHQGIILERRHWLYLVGLNRYGNREPTLMVLRWLPNSQPMLGGHATIMNPSGPTITAVVVSACEPSIKLRAAIEASHAYALTDPTIDPMILDALDQQCQALVSMTRRLDLGVRPMPLGHEVF